MRNAPFSSNIAFGQRGASLFRFKNVGLSPPCTPLPSLPLEARSYAQVAHRRMRLKPQKALCETLCFGLEVHLDRERLHFVRSKSLEFWPLYGPGKPAAATCNIFRNGYAGRSAPCLKFARPARHSSPQQPSPVEVKPALGHQRGSTLYLWLSFWTRGWAPALSRTNENVPFVYIYIYIYI